jgi:hypothetical protein
LAWRQRHKDGLFLALGLALFALGLLANIQKFPENWRRVAPEQGEAIEEIGSALSQ